MHVINRQVIATAGVYGACFSSAEERRSQNGEKTALVLSPDVDLW